jgi:hypothetical protein
MTDRTDHPDQTDDERLFHGVSDEALEAAADKDRRGYTVKTVSCCPRG